MMRLLTHQAILACRHETGRVQIKPSQEWVTIAHHPVLVEADPESCSIKGCSNMGPTIKPCVTTLAVKAGYSDLLRIDGRRVCLDSVWGLTDGTPPGVVKYQVRSPGQDLVREL